LAMVIEARRVTPGRTVRVVRLVGVRRLIGGDLEPATS
jgi:hypothetical protein